MPIFDLFFLALGGLLLWFGADRLVEGASALARRVGISELVIGLTIVALGTSLPEFLVSFTAAVTGYSSISVANVVGSNIFNLGLILGGVAMLRPVMPERDIMQRDAPILVCCTTFILVCASVTGSLPRWAGAVLTLTFAGYIAWLIIKSRMEFAAVNASLQTVLSSRTGSTLNSPVLPGEPDRTAAELPLWRALGGIAAGLIALTLGSRLVVNGATAIAAWLGVSEWLIGLTIVAGGTSLPELVTCVVASFKGRNEMMLGNLIGSDLFNFAGVLGITALLRPLSVDASALPNLALSVFTVLLILLLLRLRGRLGKAEGLLLLTFGLGRWVLDAFSTPPL
ncbi:calcium/sodium antiporter [Oleidesulfovibrio alaskensis]|uniref:calcium/sodium antiporter n=1 Tax=Oleidesulfovibrio alaskensis TaxID=58180 RepID=UPI000411EC03|nr:calcium/sodium antiporter [Oleidesulfovibrio alaskensis]